MIRMECPACCDQADDKGRCLNCTFGYGGEKYISAITNVQVTRILSISEMVARNPKRTVQGAESQGYPSKTFKKVVVTDRAIMFLDKQGLLSSAKCLQLQLYVYYNQSLSEKKVGEFSKATNAVDGKVDIKGISPELRFLEYGLTNCSAVGKEGFLTKKIFMAIDVELFNEPDGDALRQIPKALRDFAFTAQDTKPSPQTMKFLLESGAVGKQGMKDLYEAINK